MNTYEINVTYNSRHLDTFHERAETVDEAVLMTVDRITEALDLSATRLPEEAA